MHHEETREHCAATLLSAIGRVSQLKAFIGLDGFVDEIVHVVDKRDNAESYHRLKTMAALGKRIADAAGRSTNIELVTQRTKLGGNGPIMANALARLGIKVTYLGALGYPNLHPVFNEFAQRAEVHSIADPGNTNALEFNDGKLMLTKSAHYSEITWPTIQARFGHDRFVDCFSHSDLVGFVNWTMIPYMSDLWEALLQEVCPSIGRPRHAIFFDLADPAKRNKDDLVRALGLIERFNRHFKVVLGLNEKEACEVGVVLGLDAADQSEAGLEALGRGIQQVVPVANLVIHPVTYALAFTDGHVSRADGPYVEKPLITTGAGDHFNSGYCLGKLLGLEDDQCLLIGVSTSGYYVRNARSPSIEDLASMLRDWPKPG